MVVHSPKSLPALFRDDETAWLDAMAQIARRRDPSALDWTNLEEYLTDMASRDRREVKSRLVVLLVHLLKWEFQPDHRSRSWRTTVLEQRQRLVDQAERGVLRAHAESVLADAYADAVELAASETALPRSAFPAECPYAIGHLFELELPEGEVESIPSGD